MQFRWVSVQNLELFLHKILSADPSDFAGYLAEVINSTAKQQPPSQSWTAADRAALMEWTQEMKPCQLHRMSLVLRKAVSL